MRKKRKAKKSILYKRNRNGKLPKITEVLDKGYCDNPDGIDEFDLGNDATINIVKKSKENKNGGFIDV